MRRGEDKFDMSALNARIQKVKEREANPVLNMQDKVADAIEPVKTEAVKIKNRLPDPKAAIPVTGLPKWVVSICSRGLMRCGAVSAESTLLRLRTLNPSREQNVVT